MKFLVEIRVYCEMKNGTIQTDDNCMIAVSSRLKKSGESGQKNNMKNAVQMMPKGVSVVLAIRPVRKTNNVKSIADNGLMSSGCQIYPPVFGRRLKAESIKKNMTR